MHNRGVRAVLSAAAVALMFAAAPEANHSWGNYHWARSSNTFTLQVGDNVDSRWDAYLKEAQVDWNKSTVLDLAIVTGATRPKNCRPTAGRIEACNASYGNTGWLGIAQIWISGGHITQAITKLNDFYFDTPTYNTPAWRRLVTCQELAHDFGLDHQDETFDNPNVGSCMDYTNDPDGGAGGASNTDPSNEHPNTHDYVQIETIYAHSDGTTTVGAAATNGAPAAPNSWGQLKRASKNGRVHVYELDLGNGNVIVTHVFWADPVGDARASH